MGNERKKITILTPKVDTLSGTTAAWSMQIIAEDLIRCMDSEVVLSDKPSACKGSDGVIVFPLEYLWPLKQQMRYMNPFKVLCLFGGNVSDFVPYQLVSPIAWMMKIPFVVHSPFHYEDTTNFVKNWFSPTKRRAILDNLHLVQGGVPTSRFWSEQRNDRDRWIVPYQRVAFHQKRIDKHAEVMQTTKALFALHGLICPEPDFFVASHDQTEKAIGQSERMAERHGSKVHFDLTPYKLLDAPEDRNDFIEQIRGYGMFLCTADFESLGMYYLELLMSGVVGVFLDRPWVRKLLPDYPFIASKRDLPAMQLSVYNDYEAASRYVHEKTIPFLKEQRSFESFAKNLESLLWSLP